IVMIGDAERLAAKVAGPFDLVFQDGDKKLYSRMLDRLVDLLRPGGLLVTDNVLWDGEVVPGFTSAPHKNADDTRAIAEYNERLAAHPQLLTATVPLRDGLAIAVKNTNAELKRLREALAKSTRALRAADFNENASL